MSRRPNAGMRVVINGKDSQRSLEQRKLGSSEKKIDVFVKQLECILKKLDNINEQNFQENQDPYLNDPILQDLQNMSKEATKSELKQLEKLCKLAIGRRILNIQLKKKRIEHQSQMQNREKIQMFFRENRIKRFEYDSLIQQKIKQSTLIAKAYPNGKGFIQSVSHYSQEQEKALRQSDFLKVIKGANQLFYRNYSSLSKGALTLTDTLLSLIWIPIAIFIILAVTLPFISFSNQQIVLMILLGLILFVLFYVSVSTYVDKPNNKNYIQQSIQDVSDYLQKINQKNLEKEVKIQWNCDKDFMYLQVIFHDGFPQ